MHRKSILGKSERESYFISTDEESCLCGTTRKQTGSGYANFFSNVQSKHPTEFKRVQKPEEAERKSGPSEASLACSDTASLTFEGRVSYF